MDLVVVGLVQEGTSILLLELGMSATDLLAVQVEAPVLDVRKDCIRVIRA
jgi:hypothetical protein